MGADGLIVLSCPEHGPAYAVVGVESGDYVSPGVGTWYWVPGALAPIDGEVCACPRCREPLSPHWRSDGPWGGNATAMRKGT